MSDPAPVPLSHANAAKFAAAMASVDEVEDGMSLGLGTGSTAEWMVRALARRVREDNLKLTCVPTSARTETLARGLGLTVVGLDEVVGLDLAIDGADEIDPSFRLIKGGGGAHLREKLVAASSERMIVIADPAKDVTRLGAFALPVEIVSFGWQGTKARIARALERADVDGQDTTLRHAGDRIFVTDEGNYILDAHLKAIRDPEGLAATLSQVPGVVEHGLFVGLCDTVIIGHPDGKVERRTHHAPPAWRDVVLELAALLPTA